MTGKIFSISCLCQRNCETADRPQPGTVRCVVPEVWQSDMVLAQAHNDVPRTRGQHGRNEGSPDKQKNEQLDLKKLDSVLERLDGFSCNQKHDDVFSLRQHDTCKWLPETDQYKAWRNSNDSFLWLQGKAGAGKTVLAASVIDGIKGTLQDRESLVFFYCDFRDERTTIAAAAMCSILSQLLRKLRNGTGRDLIQLVNDIENRLTEGSLVKHTRSIVPFVSRAARQFRQQPFLVLDALDECQDVENLLIALCELKKGGMRPFVTSRPLHNIRDKFRDLPSISMDKMAKQVSADIGLHITREIDSDRRLRRLEGKLKMEILYMLRDKADGMFRWVQCQIDALKKCATTRDIRTALQGLPSGLDETYERILCAIDLQSSDGKLALRALVWLVAALRPLQLAELFEGLSIDLRGRRLDREIAPVHEYALLDALGSLVVYDENTDVINLSHFTVKEYIIKTLHPTKLSIYHIDIQVAHAQVALLCMCYITAVIKHWALFETPPQVPSDQRMDIILPKSHPLLHYAFSHGFRHLQCLESGNVAAYVQAGYFISRAPLPIRTYLTT
ncbi:hypothetical protein EV363DRAFT_502003 [Boletus edulis]|nr:hypothetical protein EV363DRAFT_502003 [Boletus edulis]